jgi:hypothetical protein
VGQVLRGTGVQAHCGTEPREQDALAISDARKFLASLPDPGPHHAKELQVFEETAQYTSDRAISDREFARTTLKLMRSNSLKASRKVTEFLKNPHVGEPDGTTDAS